MKFYKCDVCGKIVAMVKETSVDTLCCGQPMRELVPGTTEICASEAAAKRSLEHCATEKHVPVYTVTGNTVTVKVGAAEHPMTDAHHIEWIVIETENGNQRKELKAGDKPEATFALVPYDKVKNVYEYCNLHGLWKT